MSGGPPGDGAARPFFAYGTLALPGVYSALTGLEVASRPARLHGFARLLVRDAVYPGIVERAGAVTPGVVFAALAPATFALLDRYEGDLYERRRVRVAPSRGGPIDAQAYVVRAEHCDRLDEAPWDAEAFAARHLARTLAACRAFRGSHDVLD